MKFSELWLREWIDQKNTIYELAEQITMAGLEVDNIEPVQANFKGIIIGRIVECQAHSNIDKLWVTKIDINQKKLLNIISKASNCRAKLLVAVATVGSIINQQSITKPIILNGEYSEGILCSFYELGMSNNYSEKIIEFPDDAPIGLDICCYLKYNDNIIKIKIASNRSDCLSVLGLARDISVKNNIKPKQPNINSISNIIDDVIPVKVIAPNACPRYLGRIIKNIDINIDTPLWMKEKLHRCGIYLINVIIDIINYVLLELGQPIHVFDLDQINGGIIVRYAIPGEKLILLKNNTKITLSSDTLVISDKNKILTIAGSCINNFFRTNINTYKIFLECAFFNPLIINKYAHKYTLNTNTLSRYEQGIDPNLSIYAIERATELIITICGGQAGPVINVTHEPSLPKPIIIILRRKQLNRLIGFIIPNKEITNILVRIGCQVSLKQKNWQVRIPSWRFDITIEEDLIEEIIRLYGYDNIPKFSMKTKLKITHIPKLTLPSLTKAKNILISRGYQEVINYSFVDPKIQTFLHPKQKALSLLKPINKNMSTMRLSLLSGLLKTVIYNQNRQKKRIRLFESGLRFILDKKEKENNILKINQNLILAGVITGPRFNEHWDLTYQPVDFYDLKGDVEAILELTNELENIKFERQNNFLLHPGQNVKICLNNEIIGSYGRLHPKIEKKLHTKNCIFIFELLWEKFSKRRTYEIKNISNFPISRRDIAIIVTNNITAEDIIAECKKVIKINLIKIDIFDVHYGHGIADGFKNIGISLILQHNTRTLKENEINLTINKCITALKQKFQASLRN